MKKYVTRASMAIGIAIVSYLGVYLSKESPADHCEEITTENAGEFVNASEWIDPQVKRWFRELENVDIIVVFHHTVTPNDLTAREICGITNSRFNLGCSYAATIHENGKVIMLNRPEEHTPSVGGLNSIVLSFSFVGNFEKGQLPPIMLKRACQIRAALEAVSAERKDFNIRCFTTHKVAKKGGTLCPGKHAIKDLNDWGITDNIDSL